MSSRPETPPRHRDNPNPDPQSGVVAMFFEIAEERDPLLDVVLAHVPKIETIGVEKTASGYFDMSSTVTETIDVDAAWFKGMDMGVYYYYVGSQTFPPCTENQHFFILPHPLKATQEQARWCCRGPQRRGGAGRGCRGGRVGLRASAPVLTQIIDRKSVV